MARNFYNEDHVNILFIVQVISEPDVLKDHIAKSI